MGGHNQDDGGPSLFRVLPPAGREGPSILRRSLHDSPGERLKDKLEQVEMRSYDVVSRARQATSWFSATRIIPSSASGRTWPIPVPGSAMRPLTTPMSCWRTESPGCSCSVEGDNREDPDRLVFARGPLFSNHLVRRGMCFERPPHRPRHLPLTKMKKGFRYLILLALAIVWLPFSDLYAERNASVMSLNPPSFLAVLTEK